MAKVNLILATKKETFFIYNRMLIKNKIKKNRWLIFFLNYGHSHNPLHHLNKIQDDY